MKSENVIIFPKWQRTLEEESVTAIKERRFEEGLEKLNELLNYQVQNHEIYTGKLICLMELERYEEAQDLCESLLAMKDKHYYQYIHIYLTLLFQTNQYGLLMDIASQELESGKVPESLNEPFRQLYRMSEKMRFDSDDNHSQVYMDSLYDAVNKDNHVEQWRIVNKLSKLNIEPEEKVISLLANDHTHPVVKSSIYIWLKEKEITESVEVRKFGLHLTKVPADTPAVNKSSIAKQVYALIADVEQNNPSLYNLTELLLKRYLYVLYPAAPEETDAVYIAEALITIGNEYLNTIEESIEYDEKVEKYIQEIKTCDMLYSSIIDT